MQDQDGFDDGSDAEGLLKPGGAVDRATQAAEQPAARVVQRFPDAMGQADPRGDDAVTGR